MWAWMPRTILFSAVCGAGSLVRAPTPTSSTLIHFDFHFYQSFLRRSVVCIQRRRKFLYFVLSSSCFSPFFIFSPMRCVNHFMHSHFLCVCFWCSCLVPECEWMPFCILLFGTSKREAATVVWRESRARTKKCQSCGMQIFLRSMDFTVYLCARKVHYFSTYFTQRDTCNISSVPLTRALVYDPRSATKSLGCTEHTIVLMVMAHIFCFTAFDVGMGFGVNWNKQCGRCKHKSHQRDTQHSQ